EIDGGALALLVVPLGQAVSVAGVGGGEAGEDQDRGGGEVGSGSHGASPGDRPKARPPAFTKQPECRGGNGARPRYSSGFGGECPLPTSSPEAACSNGWPCGPTPTPRTRSASRSSSCSDGSSPAGCAR